MKRTIRWGCPLLALVLVSPVALAQATKKDDKDKPQTKDKIATSGKLVGELLEVENSTKNFKVKVTYYVLDPNKLQELINHDTKRRIEISRVANLRDRINQLNAHTLDIEKRKQGIYKKETKDIEFEGDDEVKVRTMVLPVEYDDKGKPKKYTEKEKRELKGPNKKLPGYTADWDNLAKGQTVEVHLPKPKKQKPKPPAKKKDKDDEDAELFKEKPKAVMVVIVAEPKMQ
jgi:hypothetical protein